MLFRSIPTTKIDELAAEQCAVMSTNNPDYATLAGRIVVSNHQKNTDESFSDAMDKLYKFVDINGQNKPLISDTLWKISKISLHRHFMLLYTRDWKNFKC